MKTKEYQRKQRKRRQTGRHEKQSDRRRIIFHKLHTEINDKYTLLIIGIGILHIPAG